MTVALFRKRRYGIRRKLRQRAVLDVETWALGSRCRRRRAKPYAPYRQVHAQSEVHFDEPSAGFFDTLFCDAALSGFVFEHQRRIVGWKLCFVHGGMLIDKYVGFSYSEARWSGLFFVSCSECLQYALRHGLNRYVIGWTDPAVKAYLVRASPSPGTRCGCAIRCRTPGCGGRHTGSRPTPDALAAIGG